MNIHSFRRLTAYFLAILLTAFTNLTWSQGSVQIQGTVKSRSNEPLSGASIKVAGQDVGTTTNSLGQFSLKVAPGSTIEISFIGYETRSIRVGSKTEFNVVLEENVSSNQLSNVVVIGYGRQKSPTVTGAVGTISGKDLVQTPVANITNMLVGRTSGVSAVQVTGEPGLNTTTIRIRGVATLNGQDPLIVIDGIQQPAEQPYLLLNAMDPNEVESISVLKDATATAVYGIRGANGVIIVTTRRGRLNRPQFSFSVNQGFTKAASLFETVNSHDFGVLRNEAVANAQAAGNSSFNNLLFSADELWKFQNNRDYTPAEVDAMTNLTAAQKEA
jgi:TonB-dependent SusC/RagA subfamily outer membrane receptor